MKYQVRDACLRDCVIVGSKLREADKIEGRKLSERPFWELLGFSCITSDWAEVIIMDGEPVAMYGVGPTETAGVGSIWMVATDDFKLLQRDFLRASSGTVARMHEKYPTLTNQIHMDNHASKRWLTWTGFTVGPVGVDVDHPEFQRFSRKEN